MIQTGFKASPFSEEGCEQNLCSAMITVNGKTLDTCEGETLLGLLEAQGYRLGVIAVEHNGVILKKEAYGSVVLHDGDKIEVVSFVGGG